MSPAASFLIPSHQGRDLLREYLPSLLAAIPAGGEGPEVLVVDHGGADGTEDLLASGFPGVRVLALPEEVGWSAALNLGMREARGEWVMCLHNDMRPDRGFLEPLLAHRHEEDLFAVVPRVHLPRRGNLVESAVEMVVEDGVVGVSRPSLERRGRGDLAPGPVFFPSGACALYRREVFERLGGFDPLFAPGGWEDVDLGFRAWKRGFRVHYEPASVVYHQGAGTSGRWLARDAAESAAWRSRLLFQWKNVTDPEWVRGQPAALFRLAVHAELLGETARLEGMDLAFRQMALALKAREVEARQSALRSDREVLRDSARRR